MKRALKLLSVLWIAFSVALLWLWRADLWQQPPLRDLVGKTAPERFGFRLGYEVGTTIWPIGIAWLAALIVTAVVAVIMGVHRSGRMAALKTPVRGATMMICPRCGATVSTTARFCMNCDLAVGSDAGA
jgi:zinc-ribbon domain